MEDDTGLDNDLLEPTTGVAHGRFEGSTYEELMAWLPGSALEGQLKSMYEAKGWDWDARHEGPADKYDKNEAGRYVNSNGAELFWYTGPDYANDHRNKAGLRADAEYVTEGKIRETFEGDKHLKSVFGTADRYVEYIREQSDWAIANERDGYENKVFMILEESAKNRRGGPNADRINAILGAEKDRRLATLTEFTEDLNGRYGVPMDITEEDGSTLTWNGTGYSLVRKDRTEKSRIAMAIAGGLAGWIAGPAIAGGLGFTGGVSGGVASGVFGSAVGQGITTGKLDPKSLITAGIMGGLGAWFDDMVAGGAIVQEAGTITNVTDTAIWEMSGMLGVDYETAAGILEGMIGGAIQGSSLEDIVMGAVSGWGGAKINDWVTDYFGNAGVDVSNWFRDGETNIPAEALGGITEAGFKALVAGGMSDAEAFDMVMGYFNDGGSLDFIWPEGIDLSWASGLSICPDGSESWYCNIDLPGLPDVNLPDINLPDIPNPCGEGLIWDADLLECIPDINIPNPCGEGTEWDDILQDCVPIQNPCGEGLIWDAKLNECIPDINVPAPCGEGTEWDEFLQDCVPIENPCGEGLIWDADLGECIPDVSVPPPCGEGTEWDDVLEDCVPIQNPCGEGLIWDADLGKCIPEITPPAPCGEGTEWDELLNDCVPIENPCGPGLIWDADLGECIPEVKCPEGWDKDEDGVCIEPPTVCGEGYSWDPDLGECIPDVKCPEGWDKDEDGICIEPPKPCSEGYSWDPDLKECIPDREPCPEGQERNAFGVCVDPADPKCPSGSVRDEESGECVKIDGPEIPEVPSINPMTPTGGMFSPQSNEISWETPQYHGPQKATLTPYQSIINSLKTDKGMLS